MFQVQEYLQGKTLEELNAEFGINIAKHPTLPLVILNYDQIESRPKTHPIVRECRALVLNTTDWSLVARSFRRFFNWGEVADEMPLFDFNDCVIDSKEDGSLCTLYHFDGSWHGNTRGSFGLDNMPFQRFSWKDAFLKAMGLTSWASLDSILDPNLTYTCEFVSPWNKTIRRYVEPKMYLLTAFERYKELTWEEVDQLRGPFMRPERFNFHGIDGIKDFLLGKAEVDQTFEGVVIRDRANHRWKIKNACYLALHQMRGEGDNLFSPKFLLPFILSGEDGELLTYFPEVKEVYYQLKEAVDNAYSQMESVWRETKDIPNQKEFAFAIQGKTPFTGILFQMRRKFGKDQSIEHLKRMWRTSDDAILKFLNRLTPTVSQR